MPFDEFIRIRVTKELKESLQTLADGENRSLSNLAKLALEKYLRERQNEAAALNDGPAKYSVPGRSKLPPGKRGIPSQKEN